jgi:hypothetical protein
MLSVLPALYDDGVRVLRPLIYLWTLPTSTVGLLFLLPTLLTPGGRAQWIQGVLELHGGFTGWFLNRATRIWMPGGAAAMTLGHVVLGVDAATLARTRAHERVHVRQCERWGILFLPAYLLSSFIQWCRGRDAYYDNRFEREAYARAP